MRLNLAGTVPRSTANGPGERFVVWVQGCALACPGCWNQDTWSFGRRDVRDVDQLAAEIVHTAGIEGVTFSGGEPFAQARALAVLGARLRAEGLSVFVFTGYDREQLTEPRHAELLAVTDVLVSGRYQEQARTFDAVWKGSSNQQVTFLTDRYDAQHLGESTEVEVLISDTGQLTFTGFPSDGLVHALGVTGLRQENGGDEALPGRRG